MLSMISYMELKAESYVITEIICCVPSLFGEESVHVLHLLHSKHPHVTCKHTKGANICLQTAWFSITQCLTPQHPHNPSHSFATSATMEKKVPAKAAKYQTPRQRKRKAANNGAKNISDLRSASVKPEVCHAWLFDLIQY